MSEATIKLELAERCNVQALNGLWWSASSDMLSFVFYTRGRDNARAVGRRLAFDDAFLDPIAADLRACEEGKRLAKLKPKLKDAEKTLSGLRRQFLGMRRAFEEREIRLAP